MMEPLFLTDPDGDTVELKEVFGMGQPMLALFVTQDKATPDAQESLAGANLTLPMATEMARSLLEFIDKHTPRRSP